MEGTKSRLGSPNDDFLGGAIPNFESVVFRNTRAYSVNRDRLRVRLRNRCSIALASEVSSNQHPHASVKSRELSSGWREKQSIWKKGPALPLSRTQARWWRPNLSVRPSQIARIESCSTFRVQSSIRVNRDMTNGLCDRVAWKRESLVC